MARADVQKWVRSKLTNGFGIALLLRHQLCRHRHRKHAFGSQLLDELTSARQNWMQFAVLWKPRLEWSKPAQVGTLNWKKHADYWLNCRQWSTVLEHSWFDTSINDAVPWLQAHDPDRAQQFQLHLDSSFWAFKHLLQWVYLLHSLPKQHVLCLHRSVRLANFWIAKCFHLTLTSSHICCTFLDETTFLIPNFSVRPVHCSPLESIIQTGRNRVQTNAEIWLGSARCVFSENYFLP